MSWKFNDYEPDSQINTSFEYDPLTKELTIGRFQKIEATIENNKRLQSKPEHMKKGIKDSWMHCASIPNVVIEYWMKRKGVNVYNRHHWPEVKKLLNSPEWKYLKSIPGRV